MIISRRWLALAILGAGLLVVGIVWSVLYQRSFSAALTVQVAPASSSIGLNGKKTSAKTINLRPGNYKITASHSGFASASQTVNLNAGDKRYVGLTLNSNSAATANWYNTHASDQSLAESISGQNLNQAAGDQVKKLPLIKGLPFIDQAYRIDYGSSKLHPSDPTATAIYITYYSADGKQQALDWLKFKGYDPTKLEIIYSDASPH